jgi:hypothetical protein
MRQGGHACAGKVPVQHWPLQRPAAADAVPGSQGRGEVALQPAPCVALCHAATQRCSRALCYLMSRGHATYIEIAALYSLVESASSFASVQTYCGLNPKL